MPAIKDLENKLSLVLSNLRIEEVLFITGAGISSATPTKFPIGNELHELILEAFSNLNKFEIQTLLTNYQPLEKTCQIIFDSYDKVNSDGQMNHSWHLISELFSFNNFQSINDYHKYFRLHLIEGGRHITANLDQFIEGNTLGSNPGFEILTTNQLENSSIKQFDDNFGLLYKFHGDINIDWVGAQGFLEKVISNGFPHTVRSFWSDLIHHHKLVVFVGYGGVDKYDVEPYFQNLDSSFFSTTSAIWVDYSTTKDIQFITGRELYLDPFDRGVNIQCSPDVILNQLFDSQFNIDQPHRMPDEISKRVKNLFPVNDQLINPIASQEISTELKQYL